jgi:V8-like Glu-specific endopeptidase
MPLKVVFEMDGVMEHDGPESRIRHRVNTEQGSSGSPCFDGDGELVGLHHVGDPDFDRPAQFNEAIAVATIAALLEQEGKLQELGGQVI